jgi:hypothetical protein
MLFHLAQPQPWSVKEVSIRNRIDSEKDGTGDATLPALLGVIFDEINLQLYRTARPSTTRRWARDAAQLAHACDKAREQHQPVPQRQVGKLPLAEEEGHRPAVAAVELANAKVDDPRGDDLFVAVIDADIPRVLPAGVLVAAFACICHSKLKIDL